MPAPAADAKFRTTNRESLKKSRSPARDRRPHFSEATERRAAARTRAGPAGHAVTPIGTPATPNGMRSPSTPGRAGSASVHRSASASAAKSPPSMSRQSVLMQSPPPMDRACLRDATDRERQVHLFAEFRADVGVRCAAGPGGDGHVWTGDRGGRITLRDGATGEAVDPPEPSPRFPHHQHAGTMRLPPGVLPNAMAYCATGCDGGAAEVWVGFTDGVVRVYRYDNGLLLSEMVHHHGPVMTIVTDGDALYTGGQDWKINHWSIARRAFVTTFKGHELAVRCLAITPECLASGSDDCTIKLWTGAHVAFTSHTTPVLALAYCRGRLWSAGEDGTICVHDLKKTTLVKKLSAHKVPVVQLMPLGARGMWSVDKHGVVNVWDGQGCTLQQRMAPGAEQQVEWQRHGINAMCVTARSVSHQVWTCSGDGTVRVWTSPTEMESDEHRAVLDEVEEWRATRHQHAAHYEALLATKDVVALEAENGRLRGDVEGLRQSLAAGGAREAELLAQTDALRHQIAQLENTTLAAQDDRLLRLRAEEHASRLEARIVVLQEECQTRAHTLAASEGDRQHLQARLDGHATLERELAIAKEKLLQTEDGQEALLAKNAELCNVLESMTTELSLSHTASREHELARDRLRGEACALFAPFFAQLAETEAEGRAAIADAADCAFACMLLVRDAVSVAANAAPREAVAPVVEDASVTAAATLARENEVLTLRVASLESRITELTQQSIAHACDESAMQARAAHHQSMLDSYKDELTHTAADLAVEKCEAEKLRVAQAANQQTIAELRAAAQAAPSAAGQDRAAVLLEQKERAISVLTETLEVKERALAEERRHVESLRFELEEARAEKRVDAPAIAEPRTERHDEIETLKRDVELSTKLAAGQEDEIEALRAQVASLTADLAAHAHSHDGAEALRAELGRKDADLAAVVLQVREAEVTTAALQQQLDAAVADRAASETERLAFAETIHGLRSEMERMTGTVDMSEVMAKLSVLEGENKAQAATIAGMEAVQAVLPQLEIENDTLRKELRAASAAIAALSEEKHVLQTQLDSAAESHRKEAAEQQLATDGTTQQVQRLQGALAEQQALAAKLQSELDSRTAQLAHETTTMGDLVSEITERRQQANDLARRAELVQAEKEQAEAALEGKAAALRALEHEHAERQGAWDGERALLSNAADEARRVQLAHDDMALRLDTALRENALLREDSQHALQALQEQVRVKTDELNAVLFAKGPHAAHAAPHFIPTLPRPPAPAVPSLVQHAAAATVALSPPTHLPAPCPPCVSPTVSPTPYILHSDDDKLLCMPCRLHSGMTC